ncbi:alpha/beta hydrolase family protein [Ruminiclostridium papyrosolvens]|uniref:Isoform II n=1 Tax=Ruminiclostridium papyrosolvens C7 TaxID=1330534 RepID=U4R2P0_9FIRM|nr:isoform II [Ruminiclostridium papyrosolvens]EPR11977.1 isoform II [Ruminiclostridium papyrosolvens C7]
MRLFEIVLIISNFFTLGWLLFNRKNSKRIPSILFGISFVITIIQIIAEGYRIQMLPAYICLLLNVLIFFRKGKKPRKTWKIVLASIFSFLYLLIAVVLPALLPVFSLEKPTGPYQVGTVTYDWTDENRLEAATKDPGDKRELMVQVWYPAEKTENMKRAPYIKELLEVAKGFEKQTGLPSLLFSHLKYVKSNSYLSAKLSVKQQKYPLLIFSHGFGATRNINTFEVEELASHGYIVVGIDHTYDAAATVFSNGRVALYNGDNKKMITEDFEKMDGHNEIWVKDVQFVLDKIEEINKKDPLNIFTGKIDLDKIGMFGHSYGGATAGQIVMRDSRVKAGINMDGAFVGSPISEKGLGKPFMIMDAEMTMNTYKGDYTTLDKGGIKADLRKKYEDYFAKMYIKRNNAIANEGYSLLINNTQHLSYTDLSLFTPVIAIGYNPHDVHRIINDFTLTFFSKYLLEDSSASLENTAKKYKNIVFTQTKHN